MASWATQPQHCEKIIQFLKIYQASTTFWVLGFLNHQSVEFNVNNFDEEQLFATHTKTTEVSYRLIIFVFGCSTEKLATSNSDFCTVTPAFTAVKITVG